MRKLHERPAHAALLFLAFAILPTIAFRLAESYLGFGGPWLDIDLLGCGILIAMGFARLGGIGVAVALSLRLMSSVGAIYHFTSGDAATALLLDFRRLSGITVYAQVTATLLSVILAGWGAYRVGRHTGPSLRGATALLLLLGAGGAADFLAGSNTFSPAERAQQRVNIAGSGLLRVWGFRMISRQVRAQDEALRLSGGDQPARRAAFSLVLAGTLADRPPDVVVVLVESWGRFRRADAARAMTQPFAASAVKARYDVTVGSVPFAGATTAAELRELCGQYGNHRQAMHVDTSTCLPDEMQKLGYHTTAIHGFTGAMFERRVWYERLGFQTTLFREQLPATNQCGRVFVGTCDATLIRHIRQQLLTATKPQFVHWVTLDSHLPVDAALVRAAGPCPAPLRSAPSAVCGHAAIVRRTLEGLASLATDARLRPTRFIIVGDHPPPFLPADERAVYSMEYVPFVVLEPRPNRTQARSSTTVPNMILAQGSPTPDDVP